MSIALESQILVLNKLYQPVAARSLRRVLKKLLCAYAGTNTLKAMILDPETYQTWTWADWSAVKKVAPEIIVLSRYADTPSHKVPFSRRAIYKRDRFTCCYCGSQPGPAELTIDHVVPKSRGGQSSWVNCVLACVDCNKRKAARTPAEAKMKLRSQPRRPNFMPICGHIKIASWEKFVSNSFWDVELKP